MAGHEEFTRFLLQVRGDIISDWLIALRASGKIMIAHELSAEKLKTHLVEAIGKISDFAEGADVSAIGREYGRESWRCGYGPNEFAYALELLRNQILAKYVPAFLNERSGGPESYNELQIRVMLNNFFGEILYHALGKYFEESRFETTWEKVLLEEEHRRLNESLNRLGEANENRIRMLYAVAHDLRHFMNNVVLFGRLLAKTENPKARAGFAEKLKTGTTAANALLESLLSYAKITLGREFVEPERFDLSLLLREQAGNFEILAIEKGLAFRVDIPNQPLEVFLDKGKVLQITGNLLNNAITYTQQGIVSIGAEAGEDTVVITVKDTGRGIPREHISHIFDEFMRVSDSEVKGSGLGLAITKRLVTLLGGGISVVSATGTGSAFRVTLPMVFKTPTALSQ